MSRTRYRGALRKRATREAGQRRATRDMGILFFRIENARGAAKIDNASLVS